MLEISGIRDAMFAAQDMARGLADGYPVGIVGHGVAELLDGDGKLKLLVPFANLVTDAGDTYYATRAAAGVNSNGVAQPTLATGMKLGTGTTPVAKNSTGSALGTYQTGSNQVFDSTFPTAATKGAGAGARVQYKTTYAAGTATANGLAEVVIVNDAASNLTSSAANTIARALLSPVVNKASADTLAITWNHDLLGS